MNVGGGGCRRVVEEHTLDVEVVLGEHIGALVDGLAGAVEDTTEHVLGHGQPEDVAGEFDARVLGVNARRALEHLDDGRLARHLEHLAAPLGTVAQRQIDDLGVLGQLLEKEKSPMKWGGG